MSSSLTDAIKEAYALAPSNVVIHETLEISHPDIPAPLYLVRGFQDLTLTLEDATQQLFVATAFRITLPAAGENGLQELAIGIDNIDRRVSDFVDGIKTSPVPIQVKYRPYLSTDLTRPQMDPPLVLFLTDVVISTYEVTARASFADLLNKRFPSQIYARNRFPSLGD